MIRIWTLTLLSYKNQTLTIAHSINDYSIQDDTFPGICV